MMSSNVLWRLDHLPKLKKAPKAAVVLIGTNNICWGSDTPRQGAEGVQAVAKKLHELYPETKILVLGVLPRREKPDHGHRKEIVELNSYLPNLLKGIGNVTFLDISEAFLDDEGVLSKEIMTDTTHPSPQRTTSHHQHMAPTYYMHPCARVVHPNSPRQPNAPRRRRAKEPHVPVLPTRAPQHRGIALIHAQPALTPAAQLFLASRF